MALTMKWEPDYRHMVEVVANRRPKRLPIYEHIISFSMMERVLGKQFAGLHDGNKVDLQEFFRIYCEFFLAMTYDTVSYEVCISEILPGHGAINGGCAGPIQNRKDFEAYPWDELPGRFWDYATDRLDALAAELPHGMKVIGGVGNGVFEISEDLVGLEYLAYMQIDDPQLFEDLYKAIGNLMMRIWQHFLKQYADYFVICRFGDDLGFKSGTLTSPAVIREHILPQYKRIVSLIHDNGKPFLWHSCGNTFDIMDDVIATGINAKHSNEDGIAPFDTWIKRYGNQIGLLGGVDVDILCQCKPSCIIDKVKQDGRRFRRMAQGYALGSGNSIPDYVPMDGYLAMIEAVQIIRQHEPQKN